ncbi:hypothetical protein ACH4LV_35235, partial [Streptomyces griseus]|uniref:hypothetical protein n=1 Tax=Streptomyces griseus TaxID=1911 RepID=UPI0037B7C76D
ATVSTAIDATIGTAVNATVSTAIDATIGTAVNATVSTAIDATIGTAVSGTAVGARVDAARVAVAQHIRLDLDISNAGVDANTDADRLRRTGSGQRGTRGDHRTSGYPRDANTRLLRHVLLPPVADLVIGAAICGPWPCGESFSARPRRVVVTPPAPRFTPVPDIRMLL